MREFLFYKPHGKQVDWKRIDTFQKRMEKRQARICSQRALLYTESFRMTEGQPYIIRKAKAFAHTLENMDIYIEKDSLIFGNQASSNFAAPIFPEYSIQWVLDELDQFEKREGDIFYIDEQTKQQIRSIAPYWLGNTHEDRVNQNITEDILLAEQQGVIHRGGISMSGDGHIVPDYPMVLAQGLLPLIQQAKHALQDGRLSSQQHDFYQAVIISLEAALTFSKRYGQLANDLAQKEQDKKRKNELEQIASIANHLLEKGASTFWEGVQVVYLIHVLQMIESNGHSFCYGRFDQYMFDLYQKDTSIDKDQALELITHMFIMSSSNNKVRPYGHTKFSQGYPLYSNLVVGGLTPEGKDGTNDLTYLCIEAMNLTALAEPNFSARYHSNSPKKYLKACALLIRTGCGMPSMFNDEVAIKGLLDLQIPQKDANDYCPIGCVETGVPGKYGHRATGMTYVNWGKVFELMMYNGFDPNTGIRLLSVQENEEKESYFDDYHDVWSTWERFLKYYSDLSIKCDAICDESLEIFDADPFASALIQDSMKLGKTLKQGGCRYDVISQSNIGPSVVGNPFLMVLKRISL